jgi:hypothetical protein
MPYLLKVVNEPKGAMPFLTLGDTANREHVFNWNEAVGAYCYVPTSQQESDDIIATNWTNLRFPWRIAPVMVDDATLKSVTGGVKLPVSTSVIPPFVRRELYEAYPLQDLLMMCADCGFVPEGPADNEDNVKRQLHRYYEGRAWAVEEQRRLKERVAELEKNTGQAGSAAVRLDALKVAATIANPNPKPDRAAAARAVRSANALARRKARLEKAALTTASA